MAYEILKMSEKVATKASVVEIGGKKLQGPLPVLTSRDLNTIERCEQHLNGEPNFEDYDIYARVSTVGKLSPKRKNIVDLSELDEAGYRRDLTAKVRNQLEEVDSGVRTWHPQITEDALNQKRRDAIVGISADAGANLIEGRMLINEKTEGFLSWLEDKKGNLNAGQTLVPCLPAKLHPSIFEGVANAAIDNGHSAIMVIGAPLSDTHGAINYATIKASLSSRAFVIAAEVMNPRVGGKDRGGEPLPFRTMELFEDYGVGAIIPRIQSPPKENYTPKTARRLDNLGGGRDKLNTQQYSERYDSLDLGCSCCACAEKDADEFYGMYKNKNVYSGLDALHTANVLPSLVRDLRNSLFSSDDS